MLSLPARERGLKPLDLMNVLLELYGRSPRGSAD